mmetsp:Transcript_27643/g.60849  ORF Transcript_27643/g.60849 Transcript_27643/m.60849 type:complete len:513 (+) Transcript_27643:85-1623(+)
MAEPLAQEEAHDERRGAGQLEPLLVNDRTDSRVGSHEELFADPCERAPNGAVAQAVRLAGPRGWQAKWAAPAAGYVAALFFQRLAFNAVAPSPLPDAVADALGVPGSGVAPQQVVIDICAAVIQHLWTFLTIRSMDLRLWARTLFAGSLLLCWNSLLALYTTSTFVPTSTGCPSWTGLPLWLADLLTCMRLEVWGCQSGPLHGPTMLLVVFSLGIYEATRTHTRRLRPDFRALIRYGVAVLLALLIVSDVLSQANRLRGFRLRSDRGAAALGVAFALMVGTSTPLAVMVHRWLIEGTSYAESPQAKHHDEGDVVLPPCCMPFLCCAHGRYFVYLESASEKEEALVELRKQEHERERVLRMETMKAVHAFQDKEHSVLAEILELESCRAMEQLQARENEETNAEEAERQKEIAIAEVKAKVQEKSSKIVAACEAEIKGARARLESISRTAANQAMSNSSLMEEVSSLQIALQSKKEQVKSEKASLHSSQERIAALTAEAARLRTSLAEVSLLL